MKYYHKFKASAPDERRVDGILFDSKKEMRYYEQLKLEKRAGDIVFFLMQVPFLLPGGREKYFLDFMVFRTNGECDCVDVKGMRTASYKRKKKLVEEAYPIKIQEV